MVVVVIATAIVGCSCWVSGKNEGPLLGFFGLMVERRELSMFGSVFGVLEVVEMDFSVFSSLFVSFLLLGCWL